MIDVVSFRAFRKKVASYAVFPMGETGCQLSERCVFGSVALDLTLNIPDLSALTVHSRDRHTTMRPSVEPAFTFETPIQQIEAPPILDSGKGRHVNRHPRRPVTYSISCRSDLWCKDHGRHLFPSDQTLVGAWPGSSCHRSHSNHRRSEVTNRGPTCYGHLRIFDGGCLWLCRERYRRRL